MSDSHELSIEELKELLLEAEKHHLDGKQDNSDWHVWYTKFDEWPVSYAKYIIQKIHEKN